MGYPCDGPMGRWLMLFVEPPGIGLAALVVLVVVLHSSPMHRLILRLVSVRHLSPPPNQRCTVAAVASTARLPACSHSQPTGRITHGSLVEAAEQGMFAERAARGGGSGGRRGSRGEQWSLLVVDAKARDFFLSSFNLFLVRVCK